MTDIVLPELNKKIACGEMKEACLSNIALEHALIEYLELCEIKALNPSLDRTIDTDKYHRSFMNMDQYQYLYQGQTHTY